MALRAPRPKLIRNALAGALALAALVLPRVARAQAIALNPMSVIEDTNPDGTMAAPHPNNVDWTWISYQDCVNNLIVNVPLTLTTPPGGSFSGYYVTVWATAGSNDCTDPTQRNVTTGTCWPVIPSQGLTPALTMTVPVRVQDIVQYLGNTASGRSVNYNPGTQAACSSITTSGTVPVTLYFMLFPNAQNTPASSANVGLNVELIGPAPPSPIQVGQGDGLLILNWTPASDPATQGFEIFVDPLPGHEGACAGSAADTGGGGTPIGDAQTVLVCKDAGFTDGGLDEAGNPIMGQPIDGGCIPETIYEAGSASTGSTCPSSVLVSGVTNTSTTTAPTTTDEAGTVVSEGGAQTVVTGTPPSQAAQALAYAAVGGGTQSNATITGLKDGCEYTIAVSAVDNLNDYGPLSVPVCTNPTPIDDFWKNYVDDGGLAGGGFCAFEGVGIPAGTSIFGLTLLGAATALRRRRAGR